MKWVEFIMSFFPHRWLNKKLDGTKRLLNGFDKSFEEVHKFVDLIKKNSKVRTAVEALFDYESEYGININPSYDEKLRRQQITAKKRMMDSPTKIDDVINIAAAFNMDADVKNYVNNYSQEINLEFKKGFNYNTLAIDLCINMLEEVKRAHIGSKYSVSKTLNLGVFQGGCISTAVTYHFNIEPQPQSQVYVFLKV